MNSAFFGEQTIRSLSLECYYNIPYQYNDKRSFSLDRMPIYPHLDDVYDCFLGNEPLFFMFLEGPKNEKPGEDDDQETLNFNYHEFLNIFLAYYIMRLNGIPICTQSELRRRNELAAFVVDMLFEDKYKLLCLTEQFADLLRYAISLEKDECRHRVEVVVFLIKVLSAISPDDDEINALCEKADAEAQYHIKRIVYRKTHDAFNADDFFVNLPFGLLEYAGFFEKKLSDIDLFTGLVQKIKHHVERSPSVLMAVSVHLSRMAGLDSFLSRFAQSRDETSGRLQQEVLEDLYNAAVNENTPLPYELYIFLLFCFFLKNAGEVFFRNDERLKAVTAKCTRFLNALKNINEAEFAIDEQMFLYDHARSAAWFLRLFFFHWKGVKLLLNVFRASKKAWVKENLSYDGDEFAYNNLGLIIAHFFQAGTGDDLGRLRQEMANGLADNLKPIPEPIPEKKRDSDRIKSYTQKEQSIPGFDINLFEPNPHFRYAYVRAIEDLGVDPDGKGHFIHTILDKAAETDPDKQVREAAAAASKELKKLHTGWKGGNHTRLLNEAFWWIRRAHLLTLGSNVDEKLANEYRVWENREYK